MVGRQTPTPLQKVRGVPSVQIQVAREPTACLLDVGAGLVKGQREAIELCCKGSTLFYLRPTTAMRQYFGESTKDGKFPHLLIQFE
jgi:hypothetical protein